jgi:hypothetical protein
VTRQGPFLAGHGEDLGGHLDVLRVVLGLAGVDDEHDLAVLAVDGDLQVLDRLLAFLGHPLAGLDEVLVGHVHLVAGVDVALVDGHQPLGADVLASEALARDVDHDADVDAEGAVLGPRRHMVQRPQAISLASSMLPGSSRPGSMISPRVLRTLSGAMNSGFLSLSGRRSRTRSTARRRCRL